ncbi:hypothetical protein F511_23397 [Dorcoceras hygrometricum]|uniref:Uncharacterized protein n=1 Tax=Dorcoceras hygrometricum TaxID=472368 RepID=A0A2Z7DFJ0_9LAMI|nr:hypothetical protein F511_23397 [Dorcoceras hygrometricum]
MLASPSRHMFRGNSDSCVSATIEILTIKITVLLTSYHLIAFKGNRSAYVSIADRASPERRPAGGGATTKKTARGSRTHVADRSATSSRLQRNACAHDARPASDDCATSACSSAAQRGAIAALHAQQVAHSSSDRAPSDAALQRPAFDQRRASPPAAPPGMRNKRACDRAAVARPARDQGIPSRGQRAMALRTVRDASRQTRMRCAREGAALQAAAIGRKFKNLLMRSEILQGVLTSYLSGTCAWLQPVFQEPGASRLIAVVTSIRSTTRFETPSSDCTRSPDEISTIGFSTSNWPEQISDDDRRRAAAAAAAAWRREGGGGLCSRDTASRGPTTIVTPESQFRTYPTDHASQNFVDSIVEKDLGDIEEVVLTGVEEVDLVSSDVSTVYRSPSPPSPGVDSLEHDLRFALGPAIFSRTEQEEHLYFVESPDSPPAAQAAGSIHSVADKEVNMPIDDLLIQICDDLLLPVTAAEVTMLRLGAFSSSGDKGKAKLGEDDQVTYNAARKLFALICRDVEVLVQVRDSLMQAVVDFFASFTLNSMPDMDSLKDLKEKERLMLAWAETTTLAIAVRRQLYVLIKYRELLLRTILESYQRYLTHDLPWNAMAIQVANLLSVAHSHSLEDLKAQQQELNIEMVQSQSSLPAIDYIDSGDVRLAHFYSIANSSCWVRPVFLMNGVWTPVQGPEFWSSGCNLSLFLDNLQMPAPAIQEIFLPHISFIAPDLYWTTVPWLMRIWRWTKVCEEIVQFNVACGLRPVRKDVCHEITVSNLGVERIPANFLRLFARGLASQNFVDSIVEKDLGDIEEVVLTSVEELDYVSSDVSTVYRSPSPPSPGVDSLEHDLRFALGPAIFSRTEQEERLYFVESPDSPPAVSPHHESSSSSTDVSLHFDSTDVPVHAQAPASVDFTKLAEILEDLQSSLAQRIHDSNCEMLSKLNSVELGVRGDLLKMQSLLRQSFETACRVLERQSNTHIAQITDLKKGLMGPVGIIFGDLFEIKKKQREQDAKQQSMDEQIAAIRNEHLEFQSKIAADMLSLSTQVGDIADFLRSGVAKKGEMGSSSRPTTMRAQTQTLPPTTGTF